MAEKIRSAKTGQYATKKQAVIRSSQHVKEREIETKDFNKLQMKKRTKTESLIMELVLTVYRLRGSEKNSPQAILDEHNLKAGAKRENR